MAHYYCNLICIILIKKPINSTNMLEYIQTFYVNILLTHTCTYTQNQMHPLIDVIHMHTNIRPCITCLYIPS